VVEGVDDRAEEGLEELEVEQQSGLVELLADKSDEHAVVVAVRVLALALVVAQVVAGGETGFYGDFKHWVASLPCQTLEGLPFGVSP
jgi:hypothetical protein